MPLMVDDIFRSQISAFYNHTIIDNLINDYLTHTGRISAQLLSYIFFNKNMHYMLYIADAISAILLNVLIVYMYKIITDRTQPSSDSKYLTYISIFIITFTLSAFIASTMWRMVAIQYLWGISACVYTAYILIYKNKINVFFAIFIGAFIGIYNEEIFAFCFVLLLTSIFYKYRCKQLNNNVIVLLVVLFIFGIISCLAPGNINRAHGEVMKFGYSVYIDHVITLFLAVFRSLLLLPFLILSYKSTERNERLRGIQKQVIKISLILTFLVSLIFFRYAGTGRLYMPYIVLYFCVICYNTRIIDIITNNVKLKKYSYSFAVVSLLLLLYGSTYINTRFNQRLDTINNNRDKSICLDEISSPVGYLIYFKDFNAYGENKGKHDYRNYNKDYSSYFNIKQVSYC